MVALRHLVYRRAIRIYVVAIVVPALVLLYLGLTSVQRQRDAINALRVSNLRLSGESWRRNWNTVAGAGERRVG